MGAMFSKPKKFTPPPVAKVEEPVDGDALKRARLRQQQEMQRMGRSKLRNDLDTTAVDTGAGITIP